MDGKAKIVIEAECRDKDGKLKWVDKVEIPAPKPEIKEKDDGGNAHD
jgi:hypothetical protein